MDDRTGRLLAALDPMGASLLLALLEGPRTEADLLAVTGESGQPTGNRRLHRLKAAGLVIQEPGNARAPGRAWSLTHPAETEALLEAVIRLGNAIDEEDRHRRKEAQRKIRLARAKRLGIHKMPREDAKEA